MLYRIIVALGQEYITRFVANNYELSLIAISIR